MTRTEDPDDRRAVRIELAPAGLAVLAGAWSWRSRWLAESLHDWTPEDRVALVATMTRFADSMSAEPAPNRSKTETSA